MEVDQVTEEICGYCANVVFSDDDWSECQCESCGVIFCSLTCPERHEADFPAGECAE
jgi:hypothetical protein